MNLSRRGSIGRQQAARGGVKVTAVETFRLPLALLVKITASDGTTGWGECSSDNHDQDPGGTPPPLASASPWTRRLSADPRPEVRYH